MYYNQQPEQNQDQNQEQNQDQNYAHLRFFHAVLDAPSVDIYLNDEIVAKDLAYGEYTDYLPIPSGNYDIAIFPSGDTTTPVMERSVYIPSMGIFTMAITGTLDELSLYPIQEPMHLQKTGKACVRFIHLVPGAPSVNIELTGEATLFEDLSYKNVSNYVCLPAGAYTFAARFVDNQEESLPLPELSFEENTFSSIYLIPSEDNKGITPIPLPEPRE